jgi:hypothetical protein
VDVHGFLPPEKGSGSFLKKRTKKLLLIKLSLAALAKGIAVWSIKPSLKHC